MKKWMGILIGVLAMVSFLVACAPAAAPSPPPSPSAAAAAQAPAPNATPKPAATIAPTVPAKLDKVVMTIPAQGLSDLFTVVAQKKGFYKEEGLEVDKQILGSDISVKTLIAGELDYTRAIGSVLRAATQGLPVKGILAGQTRPPQALVTKPEITSVAQLKGKSIGVDSIQGTTHQLLKAIVKHYGMDPDRDIVVVALVDNPTRLKAVAGGAVQGAMLDLALAVKGESDGMRILVNAGDITERIMGGLATSDKKIKENPDQVLRFVRAHVKALRYMRDPKNKDELIQLMSSELNLTNDQATKTYDMGIPGFSQDGDIAESAVKLEIEDAKILSNITKDVPISQVFDYSFVRKLKQP